MTLRQIGSLSLVVGLSFVLTTHSPASPPDPAVTAARGVIERTIGPRAKAFSLQLIQGEAGKDMFEVEASHGKVTIGGTDAVALTRGFYHYVRHALGGQVTWSGTHLHLPPKLPDLARARITSPYAFREYFNVCTFGYTTVWWDWKRWEREIDWMALHGVNMPLAMVGQEAVWQTVWRSLGITDQELQEYFTGPAFLPWHRMGNINKHGGPLPQGWLDGQAALQKRILRRMRELGMKPVVPAFSGFVPKAFKRIQPDAAVYEIAPWAGMPEDYRTFLLSPTSPLFVRIGKAFMQEYARAFGPATYYLADSFNELQVPVSTEHRYEELAAFGKAVYDAIQAGNPQGIWVMQGWLFYSDARFWDKPSAQALLSKVPNDRMIVLDLANEIFQGWKAQDAFYGKQWVYSIIHNFGGDNALFGPLQFIAEDPAKTLNSPDRGNLVGFGMAPEGIENNEVAYELLTDAAWTSRPIEIRPWLHEYAMARYGACPPAMDEALQLVLRSVYATPSGNYRHGFQDRPSLALKDSVNTNEDFAQAVELFLSCARQLGAGQLYINDAIELAAQLAGSTIDRRLGEARKAHRIGRPGLRDTLFAGAVGLMREVDALIAARPDMTLERWLDHARAWAVTPAEARFYEENARRQITLWGGPSLHEYAAKVWSGLIRDFYAGRWEFFASRLKHLQPGDTVRDSELVAWEEQWVRSTRLSAARQVSDPLREARALVARVRRQQIDTGGVFVR